MPLVLSFAQMVWLTLGVRLWELVPGSRCRVVAPTAPERSTSTPHFFESNSSSPLGTYHRLVGWHFDAQAPCAHLRLVAYRTPQSLMAALSKYSRGRPSPEIVVVASSCFFFSRRCALYLRHHSVMRCVPPCLAQREGSVGASRGKNKNVCSFEGDQIWAISL